MTNLKKMILAATVVAGFAACKKDKDPIIVVPPSSGSTVTLTGNTATQTGASAGNSVYIDFSANNATAILRSSWDLGFYSGADFKVILNNTSSAGAKVLAKFDLTTVGAADTIGLSLATSQANPQPTDLTYFDDLAGDLSKTVIPAVSATDALNPVIILNRGIGGAIAARPWVKLRVLRNSAGGYTVQYAGIQETTFKTLNITKDANYNFQFMSFENGIVNVEPTKTNWDIRWGYSVFGTDFGGGTVPYNFSDLIDINYLAGVTVAQKVYSSSSATAKDSVTITANAFNAFNKDSVAKVTLSNSRWTIGSSWRSTQPATGAKLDRFYIIKDAAGNYYKLKCLAMGAGDAGVRGTPQFQYVLIQ